MYITFQFLKFSIILKYILKSCFLFLFCLCFLLHLFSSEKFWVRHIQWLYGIQVYLSVFKWIGKLSSKNQVQVRLELVQISDDMADSFECYVTPVVSDSLQPMDCSLPDSSVHGIFQARILEWVAISSSRGSSQPGDWTQVSCIAGRFFTIWGTRKAITVTKYFQNGNLYNVISSRK